MMVSEEILCQFLQNEIKEVEGVRISIHPGKEHRFVIVFQGEGLRDDLSDADPQKGFIKRPSDLSPVVYNLIFSYSQSVLSG